MGVVGLCNHSLGYGVVQTKVEDGIHHTRHGRTCTRTNGNEERVLRITELAVHEFLYMFHRCIHLFGQLLNDLLLAYLIVLVTYLGSDGESGRNRNTDKVHLRTVSAFTAEQLAHLCITFSFTVTEGVNSFFLFHFCCLLCLN